MSNGYRICFVFSVNRRWDAVDVQEMSGVCGKTADTAKLQDELTGALIGLARAVDSTTAVSKKTGQVIIEGLFTTVTNVNFDNAAIENMIQKVRAEKERLAPDCSKCQSPCGKTDEYDMQQLWNADEDTRSLKSLILFGIRGMAAYAYHAAVLGHEDDEVNLFFCEALFKIGYEEKHRNTASYSSESRRNQFEVYGTS